MRISGRFDGWNERSGKEGEATCLGLFEGLKVFFPKRFFQIRKKEVKRRPSGNFDVVLGIFDLRPPQTMVWQRGRRRLMATDNYRFLGLEERGESILHF